MDKVVTWRRGGYSRRVNLSTWLRLAAALVLTVLVMLGSLSLGKVILSPLEVIRILFSSQDASLTLIVEQLRFPRIVLAALVGAALSVSGLILQSIIRNPLASPDLLGITSGASAAAVLYLSFLSATLGQQFLPLAAMLGAALATLAIYLLAWKRGDLTAATGADRCGRLSDVDRRDDLHSGVQSADHHPVCLRLADRQRIRRQLARTAGACELVVGHLSAAGAAGPSGDGAAVG
jgi:ABC-type Fe3+-siderophore transport system, permease component